MYNWKFIISSELYTAEGVLNTIATEFIKRVNKVKDKEWVITFTEEIVALKLFSKEIIKIYPIRNWVEKYKDEDIIISIDKLESK